MPIFKKNTNSTSLQNKFLQNKDISLAAKGLLGYMLSLPDNWKFTIDGIAKCTNEKPRKIISILKELTKNGYHIKQHYYENGKIKEWIYFTFAEPRQDIIDGTFSLEKFEKEQQCTLLHCCENGAIYNNINIISKTNNDLNFSVKKIENNDSLAKNIVKEKKLTKKQLKEKKEQEEQIKINNLIDKFTDDEYIQEMLEQYIDIRKQKGILTAAQVYIILEDLKKECGSNKNYMISCIRQAIAGGWSQIVFADKFKGNTKTSYSSVDNTVNHEAGNPKISDEEFNTYNFKGKKDYLNKMDLADMTKDQREFFDKYCLARDENGNLIKF